VLLCCSALQCDALRMWGSSLLATGCVCCSALQCIAPKILRSSSLATGDEACVLHCVAVCCSALQRVAVCSAQNVRRIIAGGEVCVL